MSASSSPNRGKHRLVFTTGKRFLNRVNPKNCLNLGPTRFPKPAQFWCSTQRRKTLNERKDLSRRRRTSWRKLRCRVGCSPTCNVDKTCLPNPCRRSTHSSPKSATSWPQKSLSKNSNISKTNSRNESKSPNQNQGSKLSNCQSQSQDPRLTT